MLAGVCWCAGGQRTTGTQHAGKSAVTPTPFTVLTEREAAFLGPRAKFTRTLHCTVYQPCVVFTSRSGPVTPRYIILSGWHSVV